MLGSVVRSSLGMSRAVVTSSSLHTSAARAGTWTIPDRLKHIPDAEDPGFFEMVEYYFHKSWYCVSDQQRLRLTDSLFQRDGGGQTDR